MFSIGEDKRKLYHNHKKLYTLAGVPETPGYKNLHKVKIDKKNMDQIQQRLDTQAQSHRAFKARVKMNMLHLDSNYNPFSDTEGKGIKMLTKMKELQNTKIISIVDSAEIKQVQNNNGKQAPIKKFIQNLNEIKVDFQLRSKKLINQMQKPYNNNINSSFSKENHQKSYSMGGISNYSNNFFVDIDDITKIKEQNFFIKSMGRLNIFKLARNEDICVSAYEHLEARNFNFVTLIQKNYIFKTSIYRELSRVSRKIAFKSEQSSQSLQAFLSSQDLRPNAKNLTFEDILNCATNRLSSQTVSKLLQDNLNINFETSSSPSSEESEEEQFFERVIKKNQLYNRENSFTGASQEQDQIKYYRMMEYLTKQRQVRGKIEQKIALLEQINGAEISTFKNQINDKQAHNRLSERARQTILRIINEGENKNLEAIIRQRKIGASKDQIIKMRGFAAILNGRNQTKRISQTIKRNYKK